jgi:YD repeat-containing protein
MLLSAPSLRPACHPVSFKQRWLLLPIATCILVGTLSHAQTVNLGDDVSRPVPGAGHDYIRMLNETVDPASGNLSLKIGLPVPKGRGLTVPLAITYNSGEVYRFSSQIAGCGAMGVTGCSNPSALFRITNGWSDTFPYASMSWANPGLYPYTDTNGTQGSGCDTTFSYTFYDPFGGSHLLGLAAISAVQGSGEYETSSACASVTYNNQNCSYNSIVGGEACTGGPQYQVQDSGGDDQVQAQSDFCSGDYYAGNPNNPPADCAQGEPSFTVTDKSGTEFFFQGGPAFPYPTQIEDRNGNILQVSGSISGFPLSMIDTLGRPVITISGSSQATNYAVGGLNFPVTWEAVPTGLSLAPAASSQQLYPFPESLYTSGAISCAASFLAPAGQQGASLQVIHTLELPNTQTYTIQYDPVWGLPSQITYPDGGWVAYTWKLSDDVNTVVTFDGKQPQMSGAPPLYGACNFVYQAPVVATRTVGYTPGVEAQFQQFTYYTCWDSSTANPSCPSNPDPNSPPNPNPYPNNTDPRMWQWKATKVTTTDEITGNTSNTYYTYGYVLQPVQPNSNGQIQAQLPTEATIDFYDWNSKLLQTVNKIWGNQFSMTSDQTVLNNSQSSKTIYSYTGAYASGFPGVPLKTSEYDFGQTSTPTRTTTYGYYTVTKPNGIVIYEPNQVVVSNGSGTTVAETDASYDGQAVVGVSGLLTSTHDETNYGPNSTTLRGNPTKTIKCLSGTGSSCAGPTTTYTYDETGQELTRTDPCGNSSCSDITGSSHTTTYSYANNYTALSDGVNVAYTVPSVTNAFVTEITDPLGQTENFSYDYNNSQLTSATDENLKQTAYTYADSLNRLTLTTYPDNGQTAVTYKDSVPSVTATTLATPDPTVTKVSIMDGVGHVIHTQLTTDPYGADYVDTSYDGEGHVYSESNPYRSTSDSTYGLTKYFYDALGRPIKEMKQDGNVLQWCYNGVASSPAVYCSSSHLGSVTTGSWVDSTDENGNHWQRTSDSFGRLTEVMEPSGTAQTASMETDYGYDALNDLLSVKQCGALCTSPAPNGPINRSFSYDNLARLLSASNPESGTVGYAYDANSNVQTRTDARSITTTYGYDAVNHLLSKSYSTSGTPLSCYQYGTSVGFVERLINAWTQSASAGPCPATAPASGYITMKSISNYDAMGRPTSAQQQQCVGTTCAAATPYSLRMAYDLAGNMTGLTNSVGAVNQALTQSNYFDAASRPCLTTSSWNVSHRATTWLTGSASRG